MKLHYDPQTDSLHLRLTDTEIVESEEVSAGIILDMDKLDRVVAIEVVNVHSRLPDADVARNGIEVLGLAFRRPDGA